MSAILQVQGLSKRFGGFVALDGIDLEVQPGERLGLIGPNGSGKSTLVNCICGTLQNETGSVAFDGNVVDDPETLLTLLRGDRIPREAKLTVLRGGEARDVPVSIGERERR